MAEIKMFEYKTENTGGGHLRKAKDELIKMGAERIEYLESGKPVAPNVFVSISHSCGKCAVCVSRKQVGIDIEKIRDRDFEKTVERTFGEKEKEYYYSAKSSAAFYEIWTRKEAHAKITGDGIKEIIKGTDTFSLDGFEFKTQIADGYVMTVCEKTAENGGQCNKNKD